MKSAADEHRMALMMPILAPYLVKSTQFTLKSQTISNTKPGSYHVNMVIGSKSNSILQPWIDGFQAGLSAETLWYSPFLRITIPKFQAGATFTIDQEVDISSQTGFSGYLTVLLYADKYTVYVTGRTRLKELAFKKNEVRVSNSFTITG
jgi:hypothetical protein